MFRGERIKKLRKQKHLTQTELAEKIGITSAALSQWENDIVQPTFLNIECLAEVLNVSLDSLVGEGDYSLKKTLFGTETLKREVTDYIEENCPGARPAKGFIAGPVPEMRELRRNRSRRGAEIFTLALMAGAKVTMWCGKGNTPLFPRRN